MAVRPHRTVQPVVYRLRFPGPTAVLPVVHCLLPVRYRQTVVNPYTVGFPGRLTALYLRGLYRWRTCSLVVHLEYVIDVIDDLR